MPERFFLAAPTLLLAVCLLATLGAAVAAPKVPAGHPRVYVRPSDLPAIRAKLERPEFQEAWRQVSEAAKDQPVAAAFVSLVQGDRALGRQAVASALAVLQKSDDARTFGQPMHWAACVYDWCYDLLTPEEKQAFVKEFIRIAASHDPGYPAAEDPGSVVGHVCEGWLLTGQLPAGVAIYDEDPLMYDAGARLFFDKFVPVRNFHYAGHAHHQGDSYQSRFAHDLAAAWLFRRLGAGEVFSGDMRFVPYQGIYCLRPDGQQVRSGDTYDDAGRQASRRLVAMLDGAYYDDPYLLTLADSDLFQRHSAFARVLELLFREPGLEKRPLAELPHTKYFPDPIGEMVARTGWDMGKESGAAVMFMRIGGIFFGNHQRRDFGTFQVYYKGALALASGVYEGEGSGYGTDHWAGYYHQTLAHNGLLVFDPDEPVERLRLFNDGGQRVPNKGADHPRNLDWLLHRDYRYGNVLAHAAGPDPQRPEYSYLAGDITPAYTRKVSRVTRSMVALNLGDPVYPAALVVYDRVTSPGSAFKKTWLLHSIEEPVVRDRSISVSRTTDGYSGKLVDQVLLPKEAILTPIGGPGKEFWVESAARNLATSKRAPAEPGAWRVEVSPAAPAADDRFLNVMTVMDATTPGGPAITSVTGDALEGAALLDRVVLFGKTGELLDHVGFTLSGSGELKVLVCDLQPGAWTITRDGKTAGEVTVTEEGRCASFGGGEGEYRLRRR